MKCFEIKWNHENDEHAKKIKRLELTYDKMKLIKDLAKDTKSTFLIYVGMHYPGQFLHKIEEKTAVPMQKTYCQLLLITKGIEFLRRRNSHQRKCMTDWKNYDKMVLSKDMESKKCRAPYHVPGHDLKKCNTLEELKTAKTDFLEVRKKYFPKPCHRISKADMSYYVHSCYQLNFRVILTYPEEIKIITQSKEIDFHALLGNCGSYIGLFLGILVFYQIILYLHILIILQ